MWCTLCVVVAQGRVCSPSPSKCFNYAFLPPRVQITIVFAGMTTRYHYSAVHLNRNGRKYVGCVDIVVKAFLACVLVGVCSCLERTTFFSPNTYKTTVILMDVACAIYFDPLDPMGDWRKYVVGIDIASGTNGPSLLGTPQQTPIQKVQIHFNNATPSINTLLCYS